MPNTFHEYFISKTALPIHNVEYEKGCFSFHGVPLIPLVKKYGTPLRMYYLPSISQKIRAARVIFKKAMEKLNYNRDYNYCYCIKSCHLYDVVSKAVKENAHLETSSAYEVELIIQLANRQELNPDIQIIHNGYKTQEYLLKILELKSLIDNKIIVVIDSLSEVNIICPLLEKRNMNCDVGIRVSHYNPKGKYPHSSRLGMTRENVVNKLVPIIQSQSCLTLKMVHFYVDGGIDDKGVYIDQLKKVIELYTFLKPSFEELDSLNIGGGMPINQSLTGSNDYDLLIRKILSTIKLGCNKNNVLLPNLYSEFGKYTVGESCTTIYSVLEEKTQDDSESWYMLDNSIINLLPDVWANKQQYIVLPLNLWGSSYKEVILGGLTCDGADFYNSSTHGEPLMMPYLSDKIDRLYVAFIHTGAYQDSLSGIGGVNHCLLPSHKILFVDRAKNDELNEKLIDLNDDLLHPLAILGYV